MNQNKSPASFWRAATLAIAVSFSFMGIAEAKNDKEKEKGLPPGLQKKAKKGKPLPPGWQKKLVAGHILERDIYNHGKIIKKVDDKGLITISIEGKLVRLVKNTREIVEIIESLD